ncbi:hypothetical protein BN1263170316 [Stenotrophomonas maltophilia]|nr:hypothetical protein BN1263170316 [Stenotrophomonas maltophilia]
MRQLGYPVVELPYRAIDRLNLRINIHKPPTPYNSLSFNSENTVVNGVA